MCGGDEQILKKRYNLLMAVIKVDHLSKYYRTYKKEPGLIGSIRSLFKRKYFDSKAVSDISFSIDEGELVGFIGPNGAGKTTTLKCLSGLLYPTEGEVSVLGFKPFDRKPDFLRQISLVMGQKNQLWWDLPPTETFLLNKEIYQVDDKKYKQTIEELVELLGVGDVINVQVRKLSLGQRMKCELIAALIHQPKILFLDEPTIGLDVVMQKNLRRFIKEYNRKHRATIILTSHYMGDVEELCKRIIIIDRGKIIYDGGLADIVKKYTINKQLKIVFNKPVGREKLAELGQLKDYEPLQAKLEVPIHQARLVAAKILASFPVEDINIEDPEIETIIRYIFSQKSF